MQMAERSTIQSRHQSSTVTIRSGAGWRAGQDFISDCLHFLPSMRFCYEEVTMLNALFGTHAGFGTQRNQLVDPLCVPQRERDDDIENRGTGHPPALTHHFDRCH